MRDFAENVKVREESISAPDGVCSPLLLWNGLMGDIKMIAQCVFKGLVFYSEIEF